MLRSVVKDQLADESIICHYCLSFGFDIGGLQRKTEGILNPAFVCVLDLPRPFEGGFQPSTTGRCFCLRVMAKYSAQFETLEALLDATENHFTGHKKRFYEHELSSIRSIYSCRFTNEVHTSKWPKTKNGENVWGDSSFLHRKSINFYQKSGILWLPCGIRPVVLECLGIRSNVTRPLPGAPSVPELSLLFNRAPQCCRPGCLAWPRRLREDLSAKRRPPTSTVVFVSKKHVFLLGKISNNGHLLSEVLRSGGDPLGRERGHLLQLLLL